MALFDAAVLPMFYLLSLCCDFVCLTKIGRTFVKVVADCWLCSDRFVN